MSEFEGLNFTSVDEALQGRIAGLDIVMNSGNLGSGTTMRLRGVSSINGNAEPLIVVDGNVFESTGNDDFDYTSADEEKFAELLCVNPDDIESIDVLKDAAATAVWGSQGANGVIMIKTKRGSRGPTRVTYSYGLNVTYQPDGIRMLNGDDYTMFMKEAYFNPRLNDEAANIRELNYDPTFSEYNMYNNNTNWVDAVKQIGMKHSHYVSLTGGGEKANFRVSGGYDTEKGSIIEQRFDRFSTRVNLDYFVSERIKIISDFSLTYTDNERNYSNLLGEAYLKMPNMAIYREDANDNPTGQYYFALQSMPEALKDQRNRINPVAEAQLAKNNQRTYRLDA
jgi:TonB-dependent SusC/RagA subfamily outer membrane receptor